jgi:hypothetical protein
VLLLLDLRLVSADDVNLLSPVRGELRNVLGRPPSVLGKFGDDLEPIGPVLFQSSADREKSSPVLKESSQSRFQLESSRFGLAQVTE